MSKRLEGFLMFCLLMVLLAAIEFNKKAEEREKLIRQAKVETTQSMKKVKGLKNGTKEF